MCSIVCADGPRGPTPSLPDRGAPRPLELLEREICELAAHLAAGTCRWLLLLAEFDQRRGWAEWGVNSCAHWLSWRCSIAPRSAREHVRVAQAITRLPRIREAFAAGQISYSKVRAVTRVASPETDATLAELALHATGGQLDRLVRSYRGVLAATLEQAQQAVERRAVKYVWEDDGSLSLTARLPAEDGALLLAALEATEPTGEAAPAARRADALVALARAAVNGGHHRSAATGDRAVLSVHVDAQTLSGDEICDRCELEEGPALAPEVARRLGCDGSLVRIVERDGQPLSVGRRTRVIPPALRRALRSRDRGCRFPGCSHRHFLHAHHIRHWARGGPTSLDNLVQLCSHHHRLVHEGGFTVEDTEHGDLVFRRPDGRAVPAVPAPALPTGPGLESSHRALGLVIGPETPRARSAGDRLDYSIAVDGLIARVLNGT